MSVESCMQPLPSPAKMSADVATSKEVDCQRPIADMHGRSHKQEHRCSRKDLTNSTKVGNPASYAAARRPSRQLPSFQRRESIMSSYKSELYEPRVVTFVKNGDKFFKGVKVNVSQKNFRTWDVLLSELSRSIDLPAGVRHIYTPNGGHRVTALGQFEHQKTYVCASTEPFRRISYEKVNTSTWRSTARARSYSTVENISKSFHTASQAVNISQQNEKPFCKPLYLRRKRSIRTRLSSFEEIEEGSPQKVPSVISPKSLQPRRSLPTARPVVMTVIRNGPPPRQSVTVLLNRGSIQSWEQARSLIGDSLDGTSGCLRLFRLDGEEVQSLSQLWKVGNRLIAVGSEKFDISSFLMGVVAPTGTTCPQAEPHTREGTAAKQEKQGSQKPESTDLKLNEEGHTHITNQAHCSSKVKQMDVDCHVSVSPHNKENTFAPLQPVAEENGLEMFPSDTESGSLPSRSPTVLIDETPVQSLRQRKLGFCLYDDKPSSASTSNSDMSDTPTSIMPHVSTPTAYHAPQIRSQTPQSDDLALGGIQSLVDMLLPRVVEASLENLVGTTSRSSSPTHHKTLVCEKLCTAFEVEEPPNRKLSVLSTVSSTDDVLRANLKVIPVLFKQNSIGNQTESHCHQEYCDMSGDSIHYGMKGKYQVGAIIGEGNYAIVKECRDKETKRKLALKIINKAKIFGQEDPISNEIRIMKMLRHENVVQLMDEWETEDEIYLILEQIEGGDLFDTVLHCQHFSEPDAMRAMRQLGLALVYLHAHRIVHRDIKPENIFLTLKLDGTWNLKLGGLGLATVVTEPLSLVCGNPYYVPPEMMLGTGLFTAMGGKIFSMAVKEAICEGKPGYGTKADVWAAGVICYILLSGTMPFGKCKRNKTASTSVTVSFPSPFWDSVSEDAKDCIKHLLVVNPQQRYLSSQILQHPWLNTEQECEECLQLSSALMEYLTSKAADRNGAVSIFTVTALDKRRDLVRHHGEKRRD